MVYERASILEQGYLLTLLQTHCPSNPPKHAQEADGCENTDCQGTPDNSFHLQPGSILWVAD
mgnify:CR=1 FL=1